MNNNYFLNGKTGKVEKFGSHKPPVFEAVKANDFVIYGASKNRRDQWFNRYPDYLLFLYNGSAKNNAIINGKNKYIVGQGWSFDNQGLDVAQKITLKAVTKALEKSNITRDLSLDRTIFGGFAAEIIVDKGLDKIIPHHIDFSKIRQFKTVTDKEGNESELKYGFTSDWSVRKPENNDDFEELFPFPWDKSEIDANRRYIVYYKDYRPNLQEYPLPDYIGAVPYIESDYEVSNFVINNVKNGFSASYLVNFYNGEPTEAQKGEIEDRWKQTKHGTDNAGDPILSFNEDKDSGVEVTPLPANGQDERYINLNKQIQGEIYTGHNFNPAISGITDGNGFNNNAGEIRVASEMFQNTYVDTEQKVLENFFNEVAKFNEIPAVLEIIKLQVVSEPLSEATIVQISTTDELRAKAGMPPSTVEANKVTEAISTLSPLVATKVLDNMTAQEIRELIGLKTGPNGVVKTQMNKVETDHAILTHFSNCGMEDENLELIEARELKATDIHDAFNQSNKFRTEFFASQEETTILSLLKGGESISDVAQAVKISEPELNDILSKLKSDGLLTESNEITAKGEQEIKDNEVFVVYKYKLRGDAPKLKGVSRDFCKDLIRQSQSKSWTRSDIDLLNNHQGLDVFTSRGGYYNNPRTKVITPFCRHIWEQRLVRRI